MALPSTRIGRVPPGWITQVGATRKVLADLSFHDAEELLAYGAVIQHAAGRDLE